MKLNQNVSLRREVTVGVFDEIDIKLYCTASSHSFKERRLPAIFQAENEADLFVFETIKELRT